MVKKDRVQLYTIIIGFITFFWAINTMLQIPTLIISSRALVLTYAPVVIGLSFALGYTVMKLKKVEWGIMAISSVFSTIISLLFIFSEYRQSVRIIIPENYNGTVYLVLSNEATNDFKISDLGIGYVCKDTYDNGFKPSVYKKGVDITNTIKNHRTGSSSFMNNKSIKYLSFDIPGGDVRGNAIHDLIKIAIDTNRVKYINGFKYKN